MKSLANSCDELPTSFAYMDTYVIPHKIMGHVLVEKWKYFNDVEERNWERCIETNYTVEFDLGKLT